MPVMPEVDAEVTCVYCGRRITAKPWRATWTGCQDGGVWVHSRCAWPLYQRMDLSPIFREVMARRYQGDGKGYDLGYEP